MGFSDDMIAAVRGDSGPEIAALIAASGLPAAGETVSDRAQPSLSRLAADPDRLFGIARLNKMLGWLPLAANDLPQGCAGLAPRLLQAHLQIVAMNRAAMSVTAEIVSALSAAGLRHVVLKGPFQQMAVHGQPFLRPSGDIDLFVHPRDRRRAAAVLRELGFAPLEQDRAAWWVGFLGEQHFRRETDGAVADLHHRLQQAGLPGWRGAGKVLDRAGHRMHGPDAVPVPSPADGCLLLAVTLAKALLAHEPCGWAAIELAHWLDRLEAEDLASLRAVAAASGQGRTLQLGIALAAACRALPGRAAAEWARQGAASPLRGLPADPATLRDLVFQPWQCRTEAPRRRQMLRMLAGGRPDVLALEGARAILSPLVLARLSRRSNG